MAVRRRVLFLTYYFPPSAGPGVQRPLKFARYLPEYDWDPVILTVDPAFAAFPDYDPALEQEIPGNLKVVRTRAWDPYAFYARLQGKDKQETIGVGFVGESELNWKLRLGRWARANLFLPDARVGWVPYAIHAGKKLLKEDRFDAILSTGPPHSVHLVARKLARYAGIPWLADFRDPWTGIDFYEQLPVSAPARAFDAHLERSVLRHAAAVTVVSPAMRDGLRARFDRPYAVIMNGFDPMDFEAPAPPVSDRFLISYIGNLNDARNPEALWMALRTLKAPETMPELEIRLVGNIDASAMESARAHGVDTLLRVEPYVPHARAIQLMRESSLLLLMINRVKGAEGIMTGKVFEYIASGTPVLGIGPVKGDAAAVLTESKAGRLYDFDDVDGVCSAVQMHYNAWKAGHPITGATAADAERYSRRGQTGRLAALLSGLTLAAKTGS